MNYYYWTYINYEEIDPTIWLYDPYEMYEYQYDSMCNFTTDETTLTLKEWIIGSGQHKANILKAESVEEAIEILRKLYPEIRL